MRSINCKAVKTRNFNMNPDCLRVYMRYGTLLACIDFRCVSGMA